MFLFDAANSLAPTSPSLPTGVGVGIALAYGMNWLKKLSQVPKITYYTTKLNTIIRAVTSFVATLGVSISWTSTTHTLAIGNLTLGVIGMGLYHWLVQYGTQHLSEGWLQSIEIAKYRSQSENIPPKIQTPAPAPAQP